MDLQRFLAGRTGQHPLPDGEPAEFVVHDLGELRVESGRLGVGETDDLAAPVVVPVPPGTYRVTLTSAEVDEYYELSGARFAYVSVVLSDEESVTLEPAAIEEGTAQWRNESQGGIGDVAGLHGIQIRRIACLALSDADALHTAIPGEPSTWYDTYIDAPEDGWFRQMDDPAHARPRGTLNTALPNSPNGENLLLVIARQLQYPILATKDREGKLTGIHIDMLVVGELAELLEAFDGRSPHAQYALEDDMRREVLAAETEAARAKRPAGWLGRLFGKQ